MRTAALIAIFSILYCPAHSQLDKGQWLTGGSGRFGHSKTDVDYPGGNQESSSTYLEFLPGGGYFFADKFCAGLRLSVSNVTSKQEIRSNASSPILFSAVAKSEISGFGISPFVRYYFLKKSSKINLFADASYLYEDTKQEYRQRQESTPPGGMPSISESFSKTSSTSNGFSIAAGPAFFLNPKVAIELSVGYTTSKGDDSEAKETGILLGVGFAIHLGKGK
ncbi:MAG: outer membrane beta-barrel protein [Chitinophagaceae bacterium]|nr:outer membrane beta-barrel protein [Chitinophagaceae bacterium]